MLLQSLLSPADTHAGRLAQRALPPNWCCPAPAAAGEVFPTDVRAFFHGALAAGGWAGGPLAAAAPRPGGPRRHVLQLPGTVPAAAARGSQARPPRPSRLAGISASMGKVGAIVAATVFSNVSTPTTFYCSAGAGIIGWLLTEVFLPDTTGGWVGG